MGAADGDDRSEEADVVNKSVMSRVVKVRGLLTAAHVLTNDMFRTSSPGRRPSRSRRVTIRW